MTEQQEEPWSRVSIGVDMTKDGAHVVGIYAMDADTSQIFYAKFYPAPKRKWVGLTEEEKHSAAWSNGLFGDGVLWAEKLLKQRNT